MCEGVRRMIVLANKERELTLTSAPPGGPGDVARSDLAVHGPTRD